MQRIKRVFNEFMDLAGEIYRQNVENFNKLPASYN